MKAEFTAITETATKGGYWAICPELPGANGQGETVEQAQESLKSTIQLICEDNLADICRELPEEVRVQL
jgi:predicted RNase H-like HicB family nuclease